MALGLVGKADFTNLGFDDPDLTHVNFGSSRPRGPGSEVYKGWSVLADGVPYMGNVSVTKTTGIPIALTPGFVVLGSPGLFGNYSTSFGPVDGNVGVAYTLSQTGVIPAGTSDFRYLYSGGVGFRILIDGVEIQHSDDKGTALWSADVAAYSGQNVTLTFVLPQSGGIFDIAGFRQVPEPKGWILGLLGGALALWPWSKRK